MPDHPSTDALARYVSGDLSPAELLAVDAHLSECGDCRDRSLATARPATALRDGLAARTAWHPEADALEAVVDGTADRATHDAVDAHLAVCATCREDIGDLKRMRAELAAARAVGGGTVIQGPARWFTRARVLATATLVGAAAAAAWVLFATPPAPPEARRSPPDAPGPSAPPSLEVLDAGRTVVRHASGRIDGLPDGISAAQRTAVESAITSGRFAAPAALDALRGPSGVLMGEPGTRTAFGPVSPVGTAVRTDRPRFQWASHPAATAYRVSVFDPQFEEVATSGDVTGTVWTPRAALPRGVLLRWQVSAVTPADVVTAPAPPTPEARVLVIDAATDAALEATRRSAQASHLVLAAAYLEAGLVDDARAEVEALTKDNPTLPLVASLRDSLTNIRK